MGRIAVHEFVTLDGVFGEPGWTMDYPFDPKMGEAIGAIPWRSARVSGCSATVPPRGSSSREPRRTRAGSCI
jgi:hypothetical protein